MDDSASVRRSGRRKTRPIEFWNFEKADDVEPEEITYNLSVLGKLNVSSFNTSDLSFKYTSCQNGARPKVNMSKEDTVKSVKKQEYKNSVKPKSDTSRAGAKRKLEVAERKERPAKRRRFSDEASQERSLTFGKEGKSTGGMPNESRADVLKVDSSSVRNMSQNQTDMEMPSFQNILCSTAIGSHSTSTTLGTSVGPQAQERSSQNNSGYDGVFKMPSLPPPRPKRRREIFRGVEPTSMGTIAEESSTQVSWDEQTDQAHGSTWVVSTTGSHGSVASVVWPGSVTKITTPKSTASRSAAKRNLSDASTTNDVSVLRRSTRVRRKPPNFMSFEKAKVMSSKTVEVRITRHKQDLTSRTRGGKKTAADAIPPATHPSQTAPDDSFLIRGSTKESDGCNSEAAQTQASPEMRKLCSPGQNTLQLNTMEDEEQQLVIPPEAKVVRFKDLMFLPVETQQFKCYLASSLREDHLKLYAGFIFLEHGSLVWRTTMKTNLYVIEGVGVIKITEDGEKGSALSLRTAGTVSISIGKKALLQKDGRSKMLKLFIVFQGIVSSSSSQSEEKSAVTQEC